MDKMPSLYKKVLVKNTKKKSKTDFITKNKYPSYTLKNKGGNPHSLKKQ